MTFRYQKTGAFCDLKLICKGGDIKVHKVIALSQCPGLREEIGVCFTVYSSFLLEL